MKQFKTTLILSLILTSFLIFTFRLRSADKHSAQQFSSYNVNSISDSSITILNWNIHKEVSNKVWVDDFGSILGNYSPDIITLQEAKSSVNVQNILGENRGYIYAPNVQNRRGQSSGVLTASNATPASYCYQLTTNYEPILNTPKIYLTTIYQLHPSNEKLQVINVHGINFVSLDKFESQMNSIEQSIKNHEGPQLLIGDFNTWKKARWQILSLITQRQNLSQVTFSPSDSSEVKHFLSSPLDHIFYSDDLTLKLNSSNVLENINSSDHKPLLATFALATPQQ